MSDLSSGAPKEEPPTEINQQAPVDGTSEIEIAAAPEACFTLPASATCTCRPGATSSSRAQSAPLIISRHTVTSSPSGATRRYLIKSGQ